MEDRTDAAMRMVLIHGSPRARGNTDALLDRIAAGAAQEAARVTHVFPGKTRFSPCVGCGACEKEGRCILDDAMQGIYPLLEDAHRIVLGTPVYFYGVTAQLKALIDRCQVFWSRKYLLRDPLPPRIGGVERKGYVVSVAGSSGKRVFDGVILTARIFFDALNVSYGGELILRGVEAKGDAAQREDDLKRAFRMGMEMGIPG